MRPARGRVLVRHVETAETYAGGRIVLPEAVREQLAAQQVEVMAVGAPARCEDEDCERPHEGVTGGSLGRPTGPRQPGTYYHRFPVEPGAWALVRKRCLTNTDAPGTYLCTQDDVLAVLKP